MAPSHPVIKELSEPFHHQDKIQAPVKIRWPRIFYKPQTRGRSYVDNELATDSCELLNYPDINESVEESKAMENNCNKTITDAFYEPEYTGSYPPNPGYRLFSKDLKSLTSCGLKALADEEDARAQPEKDLEEMGKPTNKRRTVFSFPLDLFHNPELELCHPKLDIEKAHQANERGVLARSRFYSSKGECSWEPCLVLSYDQDRTDFLIEWVKTRKSKRVKRLNLILDRENESSFVAKVVEAKCLKRMVESYMRCREYIEELPFQNPELQEEPLRIKLENMAGIPLCRRYPDLVNSFIESFKIEYRQIVKKSILLHKYFVSKQDFERMKALQIFDSEQFKAPTPMQGCLPLDFDSESDFQCKRRQISNSLCVAEEAFLLGLLRFYKEMDITDVCLFSPLLFSMPRPLQLEDFRLIQEDYLKEMADNFRNDWVPRVVAMIDELAPPTTEFSGAALEKLQRFVHRLSLLMTQQLLDVVLQSIDKYRRLWEQYTRPGNDTLTDAETNTAKTTDERKVMLNLNLQNLYSMPMFKTKLKIEGHDFLFDPSLALIGNTVLLLLDSILLAVKGIEDLQSRVTTISTIYEFKEMKSLECEDFRFVAVRKTIEDILERNFVGPKILEESYEPFKGLAALDIESFLELWKGENHSIEEYEEIITNYLEVADNAKRNSDGEVIFGLFLVECSSLGEDLYIKAMDVADKLSRQILESTSVKNTSLCEQYTEIDTRLNDACTNPEEMDELRKFVASTKKTLAQLQDEINQSAKVWEMLSRKNYSIPDQDMDLYWITFGWPQKIGFTLEECINKLNQAKAKFTSELFLDQLKLKNDLKVLTEEIHEFMKLGDIDSYEERLAYVLEIEAKLQKCGSLGDLYNNREQILGLVPTEYPQVEALGKEFEQYGLVWHICCDFMHFLPQWMDGPFSAINAEELVSNVEKWFRSAAKCSKQIVGDCKIVAEELRKRIEKFMVNIPMISSLRNKGMRDRHWKKLSDNLGFEVSPHGGFTLSMALQLNLPSFMQIIDEVSEFASKEYSLEVTLDKMQAEWIGVKFDYVMWRDTGTAILRGLDDLQTLLEDHIAKTQSMQASAYIAPFEDRVKLWLGKLNLVQEVLDEWINCQQQWLYLEPIFGSEDIMQQMPAEGRRFKTVDASWRRIIDKLMKNPEVLIVGTDEDLLKSLNAANKQLEMVQKGLNEYLETKRLAFPRFYFLSNDELLEILAETKEPIRVQPFCKKIFEGIHRLEFQPDLAISAMFSEENEKVEFIKTFNPKDAQGLVEKWLIQVEEAMRESLKDVTLHAYEAYAKQDRVEWVLSWPGQVVLCVSQMYWTAEVADSIQKGTLQSYHQKCNHQLELIVSKVRGKLTSLERKTIGALIVIDVHARDVVKGLANANIADETDFEWISQLRCARIFVMNE
ncbi:hypothetical protein KP509_25G018200 [Ceratopteris richardii]|uniref:Dynein heavy chain linker domain-containing protein n=1 Tax=Ceratopteris richardii TaxID=49495 RepID=A0A8T2RNA4_CERRI|nr:hypothetical protein KP509_25G018200 [Ceratopteris richardii]